MASMRMIPAHGEVEALQHSCCYHCHTNEDRQSEVDQLFIASVQTYVDLGKSVVRLFLGSITCQGNFQQIADKQ
eukprot:4386386-Amphidinium_carterae.1